VCVCVSRYKYTHTIIAHDIWEFLTGIFAVTAVAFGIYALPLIDKAHVIADDVHALITKANSKLSIIDDAQIELARASLLISNASVLASAAGDIDFLCKE
jgi:hypothetical protein